MQARARGRRLAGAVALVALLSLLSGCTAPKQGDVPPQDGQGRYVIRMVDGLRFEPEDARVPVNATVVWVNAGSVPHDVSGHRGHPNYGDFAEFGSFDENEFGTIAPGAQYAHGFPEEGVWTIWCHRHHEERMKGVLRVVAE